MTASRALDTVPQFPIVLRALVQIHEAFIGKGLMRKMIHIKGRGKTGVRKKRNSHLTVSPLARSAALLVRTTLILCCTGETAAPQDAE